MTDIADKIKALVRSKRGENQNIKKDGELKEKKPDGRRNNRGIPGKAGRKPTDASEWRRTHLQFIREHANELVAVRVENKATGKTTIVKMTRLAVTMEQVFAQVQKGEGWAVREYLDRVLGKAVQPIVGDEDEPIVLRVDF